MAIGSDSSVVSSDEIWDVIEGTVNTVNIENGTLIDLPQADLISENISEYNNAARARRA